MSRRVAAAAGEQGVRLPGGWVIDDGDEVVIPDIEWDAITVNSDLLLRLEDLGSTNAVPTPVPSYRDLQRALGGASSPVSIENRLSDLESSFNAHSVDRTGVHGIDDTDLLETENGSQTKADAARDQANAHSDQHAGDTTNVHGIPDTAKLGWLQSVDLTGVSEGEVLTRSGNGYVFAPQAAAPSPTVTEATVTMTRWEQNYSFASALDAWSMVHNLGTKSVHVDLFDPNGNPIEGNVLYPDDNTVRVEFYLPQAGYAHAWALI